MIAGYTRADSSEFKNDLQELHDYGCDIIATEDFTPRKNERPQLNKLVERLHKGDTFVVSNLFTFYLPTGDILDVLSKFDTKGIFFVSIQDNVDSRSIPLSLMIEIFNHLEKTNKERALELSAKGRLRSMIRGRKMGRPVGLSVEAKEKAYMAKKLYACGEKSVKEIAEELNISRATCYRYIDLMERRNH